jgi:hypothetical protein
VSERRAEGRTERQACLLPEPGPSAAPLERQLNPAQGEEQVSTTLNTRSRSSIVAKRCRNITRLWAAWTAAEGNGRPPIRAARW